MTVKVKVKIYNIMVIFATKEKFMIWVKFRTGSSVAQCVARLTTAQRVRVQTHSSLGVDFNLDWNLANNIIKHDFTCKPANTHRPGWGNNWVGSTTYAGLQIVVKTSVVREP